jgi:hypothetical protein
MKKGPKIIKSRESVSEQPVDANYKMVGSGNSLIPIESRQLDYFLDLQKKKVKGACEAFSIFMMFMHSIHFGPYVTRKYISDRIGIEGEQLEEVLKMLEFAFVIEE